MRQTCSRNALRRVSLRGALLGLVPAAGAAFAEHASPCGSCTDSASGARWAGSCQLSKFLRVGTVRASAPPVPGRLAACPPAHSRSPPPLPMHCGMGAAPPAALTPATQICPGCITFEAVRPYCGPAQGLLACTHEQGACAAQRTQRERGGAAGSAGRWRTTCTRCHPHSPIDGAAFPRAFS